MQIKITATAAAFVVFFSACRAYTEAYISKDTAERCPSTTAPLTTESAAAAPATSPITSAVTTAIAIITTTETPTDTEQIYTEPPAVPIEPPTEMNAEVTSSYPDSPTLIDVPNIQQYPELPTGCECTALAMLLNYYSYPADKLELARHYLPQTDFYSENGVLFGADIYYSFAGDPESQYGYGCLAPCIVSAANAYLSDCGSALSAFDISGCDFDSLLCNYTEAGVPILIWITSNGLHEPVYTDIWAAPDGHTVQWIAYEHCVVLTGYDLEDDTVYVSDPLAGNVAYDYSLTAERYYEMGMQAVCIG